MSAASNYTEDNILNALLRGESFPLPAKTYVGLHTADPGEAGGNEVEAAAFPSYVRREAEQGGLSGSGWSVPVDGVSRRHPLADHHFEQPGASVAPHGARRLQPPDRRRQGSADPGADRSAHAHRASRKEHDVMLATIIKQPADHLDYDVDYGRWLPDGDAVTMAEAVVEPEGELTIESVQITANTVKVWLSGGVDGSTYKITVNASTSGGRIKQSDFRVRMRDV